MIHKISELCDKVDVLKNKADKLRKDKYNSKEKVPTVIIDEQISDIQMICNLIANDKTKYEKYPLYKSHTEHGFIEPLKDFTPSIGCSEIVKIGQNKYVLSSMGKDYLHLKSPGKESLYFFELNDQKKLAKFEQVNVTERVRDLKYKDGKLYLFLEGTGSIGVIDLN